MSASVSSDPVVFDGTILGVGPITGVGRSFLHTLAHYLKLAPWRCVLLTPRRIPAEVEGLTSIEVLPELPRGRLRRGRALRRAIARHDAALLHSPVCAIPHRAGCPTIATVHDVPWLYTELRDEPGSGWSQRIALTRAARHASRILVPSSATARDATRCHPEIAPRILVVPHGVPAPPAPAAEADLTGPFLVLGDNRTRKNRPRLRAAHALAASRCGDLPGLRFLGPPDAYVSEAEKIDVLRHSRALVQLSLLEGFGLPIVEAFGHGVPVLCSDRSSLPEVAAGAADLADPTDENSMANALVRLHRDRAHRLELRNRGLRRARQLGPEVPAKSWVDLHAALRPS